MTRTAIGLPLESRSYSPCATHAREDRPARRTAILKTIPCRWIGLCVFLDLFPKVGKTTRPVGHSLHAQVISTVVESDFPILSLRRTAPGSYRRPAGLRNATGGKASHTTGPGFGMRPAAGSERDQASAHTTGPAFGTPLAQLILTDRTLSSFSSISPTITQLRSPNASSPHLISGSLLLPPFTHRSARNSIENNVDRHLRFPN